MGDRLDIDALLIGALYGELDGDERARLDAHLASHPADRAALDSLRSTRAWLTDHDARAFLGAAEPANAISARLIQEAARRAPAPRAAAGGGWLGFLGGLFRPIAAHPALSAAAAMLIVVGAGSLMMRHKSLEVAQPAAPPPAQLTAKAEATAAATPAPTPIAPAPATGSVAADGYQVSLDDGAKDSAEGLTQQAGKLRKGAERASGGAKPTAPGAVASRDRAAEAPGFLEVDKKALGADVAMRKEDVADPAADEFTGTSVAGGAGGGQGAVAPTAPTADAPPPMVAPRPADPAITTWARDQHARMVKLVNAGRCTEAGQVGAEIARRAPDYYQSAVANDRAVRSCQAYVDQARRAKQPAKAKNVAEPDASLERDATK
ncbi:MAG: zf-HC2 domain-containing protein [Myxococcales bacterium]|nr:zf-HC2 domain-containing protein [Myxococcales bacterium]MBK7194464.1 zf-HC2 domain-containing protein [Myxococcales bacterium]MBP6848223.1 zf-HC2 domain-containing protein [Kofleriaceae bacterium]